MFGQWHYCKRGIKKAKDLGVNVGSVDEADQIITSTGIPPNQFPQNKDNIISEIEWAYQLFQESHTPPSLIAVTGTNGKSTVTSAYKSCIRHSIRRKHWNPFNCF